MIEYSITVKDESSSLVEKDISYKPINIAKDNDFLIERISSVVERFLEKANSQEAPKITLKFKMTWQQ